MKRLSDQTLYEILEVSVDAPSAEIDRAYERARSLYGPGSLATYTLMSPDEAALLQRRIEEAKAVLLDPDARGRYDERIGVKARTVAAGASAAVPGAATPWPPPPTATPPPAVTPSPAEGVVASSAEEPPPAAPPASVTAEPASPAAPEPPAAEAPPEPPAAPPPLPLTEVAPPPAPVPIQLKNELPLPKDLLVPEGTAWTGAMLRQVREARGFTVQQVSERTKVTRHHIENIEADKFATLPAPVYLRGILMSLARELRLDGQRVARSYLERVAAGLPTGGGRR